MPRTRTTRSRTTSPAPSGARSCCCDTATGKPLDAIIGGNQCTALDLSGDGKTLVFSDFLDNRLHAYEIPTYAELLTGKGGRYEAHLSEIRKPGWGAVLGQRRRPVARTSRLPGRELLGGDPFSSAADVTIVPDAIVIDRSQNATSPDVCVTMTIVTPVESCTLLKSAMISRSVASSRLLDGSSARMMRGG